VPKIESSVLLFEMSGFEENMPKSLIFVTQRVLAKTQSGSVFQLMIQNNGVL
jgi:hypothetical protein